MESTRSHLRKWRVVHAPKSLNADVRAAVEAQLELLWYCCGSVFCDIESADDVLQKVNVRQNLNCQTPIEIPYYTVGHDLICYHCGGEESLGDDSEHLPMCRLFSIAKGESGSSWQETF